MDFISLCEEIIIRLEEANPRTSWWDDIAGLTRRLDEAHKKIQIGIGEYSASNPAFLIFHFHVESNPPPFPVADNVVAGVEMMSRDPELRSSVIESLKLELKDKTVIWRADALAESHALALRRTKQWLRAAKRSKLPATNSFAEAATRHVADGRNQPAESKGTERENSAKGDGPKRTAERFPKFNDDGSLRWETADGEVFDRGSQSYVEVIPISRIEATLKLRTTPENALLAEIKRVLDAGMVKVSASDEEAYFPRDLSRFAQNGLLTLSEDGSYEIHVDAAEELIAVQRILGNPVVQTVSGSVSTGKNEDPYRSGKDSASTPTWDEVNGELTIGSHVEKFAFNATSVHALLKALQLAEWNHIPSNTKFTRALRTLRERKSLPITFHKKGKWLTWQRREEGIG